MNTSMLLVGLGKAAFGIIVGAAAILVAARALQRLIGSGTVDDEMRAGNTAIGVLEAGSLIALGILLQHAVTATFDAMDLMYRDREITAATLGRFATYASLHVGLSVVISAVVLALGTFVFTKLTRGVDEIAEIRNGNVAPAVVLAAVMVVLAMMTAPGLEMALDGLLPLPELGRDQLQAPS